MGKSTSAPTKRHSACRPHCGSPFDRARCGSAFPGQRPGSHRRPVCSVNGELDGEHCQSECRHDGKHQDFEPRLHPQSPHGKERYDNQRGDERYLPLALRVDRAPSAAEQASLPDIEASGCPYVFRQPPGCLIVSTWCGAAVLVVLAGTWVRARAHAFSLLEASSAVAGFRLTRLTAHVPCDQSWSIHCHVRAG